MKKKVVVLYNNFFTPDGKQNSVGGIQTYLRNLLPYLVELGYIVFLFQKSDISFEKDFQGVRVFGNVLKSQGSAMQDEELLKQATLYADPMYDVLLFATSSNVVKNSFKQSIMIQHGITWDTPKHYVYSHKRNIKQVFLKAILAYRIVKNLDCSKIIVCVDYNFINWYRTQVAYPEKVMFAIPNATEIPEACYVKSDKINIIFARRFQEYRGTRLFTNVAIQLLEKYPDISITIAGSGPDEKFMRDKLNMYKNVNFTLYESVDSLQMHREKNIAVVPTLGSEGTSLSLLEAMAAGCAVVATNVGGMTNIILDGYNGYLVNPLEKEVFSAMEKLILNRSLRERLGYKAYETVKSSFSLEKWKENWKQVMQYIENSLSN